MTAKRRPRRPPDRLIRIGDAARLIGVSPSTLRYWESEGLVTPSRLGGRTRYYTPAQIDTLRRIRRLRLEEGLNGQGVRRVLAAEGVSEAAPPAAEDAHPGARIAAARRERGLSLRELGRECGLSVSFLSSLERGFANASLATLHRIARALDHTAMDLFAPPDPRRGHRLVRSGEGTRVRSADLTMESLAVGARLLEPHLARFPPGGSSGDAYTHRGEEFLHVLTGALEVILNEVEIYVLEAGDSITFPSDTAHRVRNPGRAEATALWINTPPTF